MFHDFLSSHTSPAASRHVDKKSRAALVAREDPTMHAMNDSVVDDELDVVLPFFTFVASSAGRSRMILLWMRKTRRVLRR